MIMNILYYVEMCDDWSYQEELLPANIYMVCYMKSYDMVMAQETGKQGITFPRNSYPHLASYVIKTKLLRWAHVDFDLCWSLVISSHSPIMDYAN